MQERSHRGAMQQVGAYLTQVAWKRQSDAIHAGGVPNAIAHALPVRPLSPQLFPTPPLCTPRCAGRRSLAGLRRLSNFFCMGRCGKRAGTGAVRGRAGGRRDCGEFEWLE